MFPSVERVSSLARHGFRGLAAATARARFFVLCLVLAGGLAAEEIGQVHFEQSGGVALPREMLELNLWSRSGRQFSQERLDKDIKRLYETGGFTDVNVVTQKVGDNKIDITFVLKNTPRIASIDIVGNAKYKTEDLKELVRLEAGAAMNDKALREGAAAIRKKYYDNGYYEARVIPKIDKTADGKVKILFDIKENLRIKVNSVKFTGNTVFSSWTLKDTVQTAHSYLNWVLDWGLLNQDDMKLDERRLRNLYWTKGYLDFVVKPEVIPLKDEPDYADVVFHITEGKPYEVGKVTISGETRFKEKRLLKSLRLRPGETYNYEVEQADVKRLRERYDPLGYCEFRCDPKLDPDFATHKVNVDYVIAEGKPYKIQNVNISGNQVTKDYVMRRELPIQPGDPVDQSKIDAGKSRLMGMGYFDKVDTYNTAAAGGNVEDKKDVNYEVKEKGTAHVSVGAGWSSSDSLVGRVELSESDFDISDPRHWFRGGGQRIDLMGQVGILDNALVLSFTEPWLFNMPLRLDTSGFFRYRKYDYWTERHAGGDISLTKPVFSNFNTISLGYIIDFVHVSQMDHRYSEAFRKEQEGDHRKGAFRLSMSRDTRDDVLNPTSGYELTALSEVNSEVTGGSDNSAKLEGKASGYWNFFEKLLVLHLGAKLGAITGIGNGGDVPLYERYLLGGQESLRGFGFRKVSPLNEERMPLGGQSMYLMTAEVTHPIYKWVRGAIFADAGDVWKDMSTMRPDLNVGVGYGLRILIPQLRYPIKLDFGIPVHRTNLKFANTPQFYFNVGFNW